MRSKRSMWFSGGVAVCVLLVFLVGLSCLNDIAMAQTNFQVTVNVKNEICGAPIAGAEVEIAADAGKISGLGVAVTDANGVATFTDLPNAGPFEVGVSTKGFRSAEFFGDTAVNAGDVLDVELTPRGVTTPGQPKAISSPKSVYIDWPANPELDVKGYNVYRTLVSQSGAPLGEPVKLNGSTDVEWVGEIPYPPCGDTPIKGLEYMDSTVVKGSYYVYQIQAISGANRPSALSAVSNPPVKGQWLTIFFPDIYYTNEPDLRLWDRTTAGMPELRIPVSSRCAYDVDATSMQIIGELTADLLNASPYTVELTGITAGMAISANVIPNGAVENTGDHQVRIAGAGVETRNLYGSGELFNIYLTPTGGMGSDCGPLHLSDDAVTGDGVILYNDPFGPPIEIELEDGTYCSYLGCMHGDVNMDETINNADSQYLLDYIARQTYAPTNDCFMEGWDINLDNRVTTQDSTLIQRWVLGMDINPPAAAKSADLALESFAAAAVYAVEKAETEPTVWADKPEVAVGATVDVLVYISNAAPLAGFTLTAAYAADEVEFTEATLGSAMPGNSLVSTSFEITGETNEYGSLTVAVTNPNATMEKAAAELVKLSFKRTAGATAKVPVVLTSFDMNDPYGHAPRQTDPMAPVIKDSFTPDDGEGEEGEGEGEGEPETSSELEGLTQAAAEALLEAAGADYEVVNVKSKEDGAVIGTVASASDADGDTNVPLAEVTELVVINRTAGFLGCGASTASGSYAGDLMLLGFLMLSLAAAPYLRKRVN